MLSPHAPTAAVSAARCSPLQARQSLRLTRVYTDEVPQDWYRTGKTGRRCRRRRLPMASSYPSAQSDHHYAAVTTDTTISQSPPHTYTYPGQDDSQPPSPNGISAAAILATMSDSRPPTSHADSVDHLEEEDTEAGGISLTQEWEGMTYTPYPAFFEPPQPTWLFEQDTIPQFSHGGLDVHAAALEALTMESQSPHPTVPPSLQEDPVTTLSNTIHEHDLPSSTYATLYAEIHGAGSFVNITTFFELCSQHMNMVTRPLDSDTPPEVIRREDLEGDKYDFQGIDWSERAGRETIRKKRAMVERPRVPHKAWQGIRGAHELVGDFRHAGHDNP